MQIIYCYIKCIRIKCTERILFLLQFLYNHEIGLGRKRHTKYYFISVILYGVCLPRIQSAMGGPEKLLHLDI